jgi:hypothetical protein
VVAIHALYRRLAAEHAGVQVWDRDLEKE